MAEAFPDKDPLSLRREVFLLSLWREISQQLGDNDRLPRPSDQGLPDDPFEAAQNEYSEQVATEGSSKVKDALLEAGCLEPSQFDLGQTSACALKVIKDHIETETVARWESYNSWLVSAGLDPHQCRVDKGWGIVFVSPGYNPVEIEKLWMRGLYPNLEKAHLPGHCASIAHNVIKNTVRHQINRYQPISNEFSALRKTFGFWLRDIIGSYATRAN